MDTNGREKRKTNRRLTQIRVIRESRFRVNYYGKSETLLDGMFRAVVEAQTEICVYLRPSAVRFPFFAFIRVHSWLATTVRLRSRTSLALDRNGSVQGSVVSGGGSD